EPNQVTVRQWLENWMEVYQANTITPNFYVRRLDLIKLHINPTLGDKQLMKLRPADIKALYNRLEKNGKVDGSGGLSSQSIRHIHNILNPTMKQAVKEGLIAKNMVADVRPPKLVRTKEARPLDKEEASRYLKQIANHRLYAAFLLELTTGLRRGELLGVQWGDLNPDTGALKIRRQVSRVKLPGNPSTLEYAPLKTPSSYRTIMLPAITLKALESHRKQQNEEKMRWRTIYPDEDLIFCTPLGGKLDTRRLYHVHIKALEDAKIPHTAFHNLRHTVATVLLQAGENIKTIQDMLGHSDVETTLNCYSHVLEDMKKGAADKLKSIFGEVLSSNPEQENSPENVQAIKKCYPVGVRYHLL
ncbi:MAG: site-specific integrase, partial [Syntrophomonas sp.]